MPSSSNKPIIVLISLKNNDILFVWDSPASPPNRTFELQHEQLNTKAQNIENANRNEKKQI